MRYTVLDIDGFSRSGAGEFAPHFEVDQFHIAHAARGGEKMTAKDVARAIKQYKIDAEKPNPVGV